MRLSHRTGDRAIVWVGLLAAVFMWSCGDGGDGKTPPPPDAPTGVSAVAGSTEVSIYWDPVPDATSYNLYWSTSSGVTRSSGTQIPDVVSGYLHTGLVNGTTYYYVVTALEATRESSYSTEISARPDTLGILDDSFGGRGWVVHDSAAGGGGDDFAWAISLDATGRILLAGWSVSLSGDTDMAIWRYAATGSLDSTFGNGGVVVHDSAAGGGLDDRGQGIALDATGRILVAGCSTNVAGNLDMVVWRLQPTGSLDTAFGAAGVAVHDGAAGGNTEDRGDGILVSPSGRILVAGFSRGPGGDKDMVIWGYTDNGTLDTSFGAGGVVVHDDAAGGNGDDWGRALQVDASGRIVVVGFSERAPGDRDMVIWRFGTSGALDPTFGIGGVVVHDNAAGGGWVDLGEAMALDPSDRLVVAGSSWGTGGDLDAAIWRYTPTGSLDTTFGGGGVAFHGNAAGGNSHDGGLAMALDTLGRILVAGYSYNAAGDEDLVILRYGPTGTLDPAFGSGGVVLHSDAAGGNGHDTARAMTVDASGRILVAGWSVGPGADADIVLWRYR